MIKLIVLGSAQDGGVPHLGCTQEFCERARRDASFARWVACLALMDTEAQRSFLIDVTPDVRSQLDYLTTHRDMPPRTSRNPVDGVILTHAHIGHYAGLIQFGKEVMATHQLPTYCTASMRDFLRNNGPWAQLVRDEHLSIYPIIEQQTIRLTDHLTIRPSLVPHRHDWSDTIGLELIGPSKRVLYIPDVDRWSDWELDIRDVVSRCDIALLDGCFYSADELPGRDMSQVPHPLITETMERLTPTLALSPCVTSRRAGRSQPPPQPSPAMKDTSQGREQARTGEGILPSPVGALSDGGRVGDGGIRVFFTHLNHTNPAIDRESPQRREIEARGFHVAEDRMEFEL